MTLDRNASAPRGARGPLPGRRRGVRGRARGAHHGSHHRGHPPERWRAGRFGGHPLRRWSRAEDTHPGRFAEDEGADPAQALVADSRGRRRRHSRSCRRAPGLGLGDRLPHAAHAHRAAGRLRGGGGVPRVQVGHAGHPRGGRALHALAQHHRRAHLGAAGAGGRDAGHGPRVPRALPEPGAAGRRPGRARAAPRHPQDRRGRGPLPAQHAAGGEPRGAALSAQLPDHVQREHRARAAPGGGAGSHPGRVHRGTRAHLLQRHRRCATASTPGSTRAAW
jgi:hypothetical protein